LNLGALARELKLIAAKGGGFGSEVEASLKSLASTLEQRADWEIAELAKALKPRTVRTKKAVTFDAVPSSEVVGSYVDQLQRKQPTADALSVLDRIMKDKRVKRDQLFEIAGRFLGAKLTFKTRGDAEAAVRDRLTRRDWDQASIKLIGDRAKS